jgi:hypothetical protein
MTGRSKHNVQHGLEFGVPKRLLQKGPVGMGGWNIGPPHAGCENEGAGARRQKVRHGIDPLRPKIHIEKSAVNVLPADKRDRSGDIADASDVETKLGQGINERERDERLVLDNQNSSGGRIIGGRNRHIET